LSSDIKSIAEKAIRLEADSLQRLADNLSDGFTEAVKLIAGSRGRLVIAGVGKNIQVGKKIVATLNSTGTPALFMNPSDAIHGDLGILQPDDILLIISKSGASEEIKKLIPLIKPLKNLLIAFVSDPDSYLALQADIVVNVPVEREACPYNLAPTTSTTSFMVIGDAMAICLLEIKGFSSSDFARLHPGGSLGKKLTMRVADLYLMNKKPEVWLNTRIPEVIVEISSKRLGATAVLDQDNRLQGIITDGDLRRMMEKHEDFRKLEAKDIMTPSPKTTAPETNAYSALQEMKKNSITQLIVMHDSEYLGVIHIHDILREGIA
jgi:arabinose-5-phosphate isomerase